MNKSRVYIKVKMIDKDGLIYYDGDIYLRQGNQRIGWFECFKLFPDTPLKSCELYELEEYFIYLNCSERVVIHKLCINDRFRKNNYSADTIHLIKELFKKQLLMLKPAPLFQLQIKRNCLGGAKEVIEELKIRLRNHYTKLGFQYNEVNGLMYCEVR
jgi:hypothetical protein